MKTRKRMAVIVGFAFFTAMVAGHFSSALAENSGGGGILNLAENADFRTLDPAGAGDGMTIRGVQFLYTRLVRYTGENDNEIIPALAESWSWSKDGKSITFKLRQGLTFSDGSPLSADDVVFTFTRLLDPKTKAPYQGAFKVIQGAQNFIDGKETKVDGIQAVDPQTIRFDLEKPVPYFLDQIALPCAGIVSQKAVAKYGDKFGENPVGAGPFVMEHWTRGQELVLVKNPHYYLKGLPKLDSVVIKLGISDNLQMMMFQKGELDMVGPISAPDYLKVQDDPKLKACYYSTPGPKLYYLGMNVEIPPFDNKLVRQAFNFGVDKDKLVQLENGRAQVMGGAIPPWVSGYDAKLSPYPYDPKKAKELLAQAGFPNGFEVDMLVPEYRDIPQIAASVQIDLAKIGVKLNLRQQAYPVFRQTVKQKGKVAFFALQWGTDFPDPENVLSLLFNGAYAGQQNFTWFNDTEINKLLDNADVELDPAKRMALYQQADKKIHEDAPWVFLFYAKADAVKSPLLVPPADAFGRIPVQVTEYNHYDAVAKRPQ
jgi:ABC-type transport system substrate-binding protein